jgi:lipoyl-dependent peroxiredoxin
VPGASEEEFQPAAEGAKKGCPVSRALGGVESIEVDAQLLG